MPSLFDAIFLNGYCAMACPTSVGLVVVDARHQAVSGLVCLIECFHMFCMESLILAQDERWRRA